MGKEEASSEHSNMQEELEQVATAFNKQETQKKRERLEAMFNIPDCIKKGGVSYPDNLIGIAECSVVERRSSGSAVGKAGKFELYRIGEHNQSYRLESKSSGITHFYEFNAHHILVNSELGRIVFTESRSP
jgi:hypothetical protein